MKRLGPELKKPEMKVPPVLRDLYLDLRDRRLLPLLALVLVAIVAVPFLLSEDPEEASRAPKKGVAVGKGSKQASLTVVRSAPGLRDYRRRLKRRDPTDPFHQRYTSPVLKGAELGSESSTSESSSESKTGEGSSGGSTPVPVPVVPGGGPGGRDSDGNGIPDGVSLYTYVLDLQITRIQTKPDGTREQTGPKIYKDVKAPTPLPGEKTPVVTYLGLGAREPRRPMFLISPEVTAVYGEAECISGTSSCQLIALQERFPVTFVYGENEVRYKINLLDVTPVPVAAPR